jgi:hypothetical protein
MNTSALEGWLMNRISIVPEMVAAVAATEIVRVLELVRLTVARPLLVRTEGAERVPALFGTENVTSVPSATAVLSGFLTSAFMVTTSAPFASAFVFEAVNATAACESEPEDDLPPHPAAIVSARRMTVNNLAFTGPSVVITKR